jgi:hypothetical protein
LDACGLRADETTQKSTAQNPVTTGAILMMHLGAKPGDDTTVRCGDRASKIGNPTSLRYVVASLRLRPGWQGDDVGLGTG